MKRNDRVAVFVFPVGIRQDTQSIILVSFNGNPFWYRQHFSDEFSSKVIIKIKISSNNWVDLFKKDFWITAFDLSKVNIFCLPITYSPIAIPLKSNGKILQKLTYLDSYLYLINNWRYENTSRSWFFTFRIRETKKEPEKGCSLLLQKPPTHFIKAWKILKLYLSS